MNFIAIASTAVYEKLDSTESSIKQTVKSCVF